MRDPCPVCKSWRRFLCVFGCDDYYKFLKEVEREKKAHNLRNKLMSTVIDGGNKRK